MSPFRSNFCSGRMLQDIQNSAGWALYRIDSVHHRSVVLDYRAASSNLGCGLACFTLVVCHNNKRSNTSLFRLLLATVAIFAAWIHLAPRSLINLPAGVSWCLLICSSHSEACLDHCKLLPVSFTRAFDFRPRRHMYESIPSPGFLSRLVMLEHVFCFTTSNACAIDQNWGGQKDHRHPALGETVRLSKAITVLKLAFATPMAAWVFVEGKPHDVLSVMPALAYATITCHEVA